MTRNPPKRFPICRVCGQRYDNTDPLAVRHHVYAAHGPQALPKKKLPPISEVVGKSEHS
jgi:hypothetical protein